MKKVNVLLAFLLLITTAFSAEDYQSWVAYRNITVDTRNQAGGANVATAQTGFPLLVRLNATNAPDVFTGSQGTNGSDIRFGVGATHLAYQKERWDATNKLAEFWVLVPTIKGNDTTQIQIYWGKSGVADSSNAAAVFNSGSGFRAVWHFEENASPSADATPYSLSAAWQNSPASTTGLIGSAINLANGTGATGPAGKFLTAANIAGGLNMSGTAGVTLSFWARRTGNNSGNTSVQMLAGRYNYSDLEMQFGLVTNAAGALTLYYAPSGNADMTLSGATTLAANTWYHVTATLTSNSQIIYVNGVQKASAATAMTSLDGVYNDAFTIGVMDINATYSQYFNGALDEMQYSSTARSAGWVKLTYQTQRTDSTFVTVGSTNLLPPTNLSYAPNPAVYTVGFAIPSNSPTVRGSVSHYSVSPGLPAGLSLDTVTGVVSGTPTSASAAANYTITATNTGGSTTAPLNITVNASVTAPTAVSYSSSPVVYGVNVAIANNAPVVTGTATTFSVLPALPAGLALSTSTGVISGTPTAASAAANYTVTAGNTAGSTTGTVNITVLAAPSALSYSSPKNYPMSQAIPTNSPTVTGTVSSYSIAPALPLGLSFNTTTGTITGTPTVVTAATTYTVTASNLAGSTTATISIAVYGPPTGLYYSSNPVTYVKGQAITPNTATAVSATHFSVSPALPAGLVLDTVTGTVSGTPSDTTAGYVTCVVTASNPAGSTTVGLIMLINKPTTSISPAVSSAFVIRHSGSSMISFQMPEGASRMQVSISDIWGRTVWSRTLEHGKAQTSWNGVTRNGEQVGAGLYIVRAKITDASHSSRTLEEKINYTP